MRLLTAQLITIHYYHLVRLLFITNSFSSDSVSPSLGSCSLGAEQNRTQEGGWQSAETGQVQRETRSSSV